MRNRYKILFFSTFISLVLGCQNRPAYKIASHSPEEEGVKTGQYIPAVQLLDTTLHYQNIEQNMGKATLIDFWASWCRPCRESANPAYKKLYDKYHKKGLNIIGISSDRHRYFWKKAIREDSLPWPQFIDSTHIIVKKFKVKSIPTLFLIDRNGKITGKNLWGKDLERKIDSLLQ